MDCAHALAHRERKLMDHRKGSHNFHQQYNGDVKSVDCRVFQETKDRPKLFEYVCLEKA